MRWGRLVLILRGLPMVLWLFIQGCGAMLHLLYTLALREGDTVQVQCTIRIGRRPAAATEVGAPLTAWTRLASDVH